MRKMLGIATGVIAMAMAVGGAGLAAASTRPAVSGTEHFQFVSTSATSNRAEVIAYGAFAGHAVDIQGSKVDTFKFPNGSFKVTHSRGTGTQSFDPKTCLFIVSRHGTYSVGQGTGAYKGISGSGKYQASVLGIGQKSGGQCAQHKPPAAVQQIIRASGPVHL